VWDCWSAKAPGADSGAATHENTLPYPTLHSGAPPQAWGLMELQRGNVLAAVLLLERSVLNDPARCSPVLRWKAVRTARQSVSSRRRLRSSRGGFPLGPQTGGFA